VNLTVAGAIYEGHELDELYNVGDTHPSATATVRHGDQEILYVTKSNSDAIGLIRLGKKVEKLADFDLSPIRVEALNNKGGEGQAVHGSYPNAIIASPGGDRIFVAEAGLNSVAVLDTRDPDDPRLIGRIPTGWYPTALALSADGRTLYVVNAKGVGEDVNPNTNPSSTTPPSTGLASFPGVDSNYIFGSVQKVDLSSYSFDNRKVLENNFALQAGKIDTSVVPAGGKRSKKIKHVFFILHENKTFDSMLGNLGSSYGPFASLSFNNTDGTAYMNRQFTGVSLNTQQLAQKFATAVNYYSDSEESDAGHQFAASGTSTDFTQKTLLVKSGRGVLVNKNFEPEDYPEGGYIFNNAARNGVSFKDYGAMIRIAGTDTGASVPTLYNDPYSGLSGFPQLQANNIDVVIPLNNLGDVKSPVSGLGQSYFLNLPVVAVLGGKNSNGEDRLDRNYPGYNFNISDQRRAKEFIADFDRLVANGTLPEFIYIYQPNDHTGSVQAPNKNIFTSSTQEVADGDVALGMVVKHIMQSKVYYDSETGEGSVILVTYDDAQSSLDHIHPHRTPLIAISPYARPGYAAKQHYSTASIVKTEELLLGLPPNNLGDLFATDLRDMFQPTYNGITAVDLSFTLAVNYKPSREGERIWALASQLDTSSPDRDSRRLGMLARLSLAADDTYFDATANNRLNTSAYRKEQRKLYRAAVQVIKAAHVRDLDD
jgi:DNA-binding beta-propeller fold protein YncE